MKDSKGSAETGHETKENRSENSAADINTHNTATFWGIKAIALTDKGNIRFTGYGMGRTDGFPLESKEHGKRYPDKDGAQVSKFL